MQLDHCHSSYPVSNFKTKIVNECSDTNMDKIAKILTKKVNMEKDKIGKILQNSCI